MKKIYNIISVISIIYFFIMIGLDVHFIINNEENIASGVPVFGENVIYILSMAIPLFFLFVVRSLMKFVCKRKGINLSFGLKKINFKMLKGAKLLYLIVILSVIFALIVLVLVIQNKLLYYPSYDSLAYMNLTMGEYSALEEITISTDTESYHGWGYKKSSDCPTVIYFGGNAQSSENFFWGMEEKSGWESFANCNVIMIDYPGYGLSEGKPGYQDILQMADTTYQYVKESDFYGNNEVIVIGFSLGTGVATYVASSYDVDGLILVAPYNNANELYNNVCNIFHGPLKVFIRNPFPSDQFAENITTQVLIIASEDDEVIPYELSCELKDAFTYNEFFGVKGLYHNDLLDDASVLNKIKQYLSNF